MNIELSPGIFYTGVNDRTTHLFESLWPLPFGISYNSYLIVDEKVTLIDIAEESMREQHFMKIKAVLGEREIDYVIDNHIIYFTFAQNGFNLHEMLFAHALFGDID